MGSASLTGRHVMANALRGELHAMGDVIHQPITGNVLKLEDALENFNNAMENALQEALHVEPSVSVIRILTAMGIGTIGGVEIPVSPNGNPARSHVPLDTISANTSGDMEAMTDAFPSTTSREATTSIVGSVIFAHLDTISAQLTRAAPALRTS